MRLRVVVAIAALALSCGGPYRGDPHRLPKGPARSERPPEPPQPAVYTYWEPPAPPPAWRAPEAVLFDFGDTSTPPSYPHELTDDQFADALATCATAKRDYFDALTAQCRVEGWGVASHDLVADWCRCQLRSQHGPFDCATSSEATCATAVTDIVVLGVGVQASRSLAAAHAIEDARAQCGAHRLVATHAEPRCLCAGTCACIVDAACDPRPKKKKRR